MDIESHNVAVFRYSGVMDIFIHHDDRKYKDKKTSKRANTRTRTQVHTQFSIILSYSTT